MTGAILLPKMDSYDFANIMTLLPTCQIRCSSIPKYIENHKQSFKNHPKQTSKTNKKTIKNMSQNLLKIVPKSDAVLTFVLPNRCEYPPFAKTGILGQTWEQEKKVPPGEYNFLVDFGTPSGTHFRSKIQKKKH